MTSWPRTIRSRLGSLDIPESWWRRLSHRTRSSGSVIYISATIDHWPCGLAGATTDHRSPPGESSWHLPRCRPWGLPTCWGGFLLSFRFSKPEKKKKRKRERGATRVPARPWLFSGKWIDWYRIYMYCTAWDNIMIHLYVCTWFQYYKSTDYNMSNWLHSIWNEVIKAIYMKWSYKKFMYCNTLIL